MCERASAAVFVYWSITIRIDHSRSSRIEGQSSDPVGIQLIPWCLLARSHQAYDDREQHWEEYENDLVISLTRRDQLT